MRRHSLAALGLTAALALLPTALGSASTAQAYQPLGDFTYFAYAGSDCTTDLNFTRAADGSNTAEADFSTNVGLPSYMACEGALFRSSDGGSTYQRISANHWLWGNGLGQLSSTDNYYDGAAYLAKACVRIFNGHTDSYSSWSCTSSH